MTIIRTRPMYCSNCNSTVPQNVNQDKKSCVACGKQLCTLCAPLVICKDCTNQLPPSCKQRASRYQAMITKISSKPVCLCLPAVIGATGYMLLPDGPNAILRIVLLSMFWTLLAVIIVLFSTSAYMGSELNRLAKMVPKRALSKKRRLERNNPEVDFRKP